MRNRTALRSQIIDHTAELFRTRGVKATTIKLISGKAGCTNAALYYYFEHGKRQILEEVIRESPLQKCARLKNSTRLEVFLIY